jgi:quinol monooxygenase YgiN
MAKYAIWAVLESKPGKEKEVEEFLKQARSLAEAEPATVTWYAAKLGPSTFAIFDTFHTEEGRKAHLNGQIAKALFAKAKELFAKEPEISQLNLLAAKGPSEAKQAGASS